VDEIALDQQVDKARELAGEGKRRREQVAGSAARMAAVEEFVAEVHEHLAETDSPVAEEAAAMAAQARRVAEQEREEQRRWSTADE
jgi:hypothetical protein